MWVLAQTEPVELPLELYATPHAATHLYGVLGTAGGLFWVAMLVYCVWKDEEERHIWLWILFFLNIVGALVYFVVRVVPRTGLIDKLGAGGRRRRAIAQVEAEIVHLGEKPHLLHRLGSLQLEGGLFADAERHLRASLAKEDDRDVRFDLARTLAERGAWEEALGLLTRVTTEDRNHAYGDALRLHARALTELGKDAEARPLLEELVRTRPSAETRVRLALLLERAGDRAAARDQCVRCEKEAAATPVFAQGRARTWVKQARALARKLA